MDDDVVTEFLLESNALLDDLDGRFVQLAEDPENADHVAAVFRGLHTIKGSCGFLGFANLERLTHAGESLFSRVRDGDIYVDDEIAAVVGRLGEAIRNALAIIEGRGDDGSVDCAALTAELARLRKEKVGNRPGRTADAVRKGETTDVNDNSAVDEPQQETNAPTQSQTEVVDEPAGQAPDPEAEPKPEPLATAPQPGKPDARPLGEILVSRGICKPEHIVLAVREQQKGDPRRLGEILVEKGHCRPQDIKHALESQGEQQQAAVAENSIRVDVSLLDKLMNLVGELVLARNQVQQFTTRSTDAELLRASARLNLITTELQEGVMQTRMQPIGNVWNKFPRVVRHLAVICNKSVRIEMDGQDTELDKTILEAIKDPLTHFVRNAVDHGIESPADRRKAGKPEEGTLHLRAFHEGGQVNMEISDDGRGIDVERVRAKALERGLINSVQAARMTDREVANLVFEPGFSTAEAVTNVSGRGVGMDVVKTNIERIGGSIELLTEKGKGTTLKVKIPLTLAIIPALLVSGGDGCYALPQISLVELVRLEGAAAEAKIERVHGAPVYRLRGRLLPIVYLSSVLAGREPSSPTSSDVLNIVVLQADDRQFGLVVDEVRDTAEIVVKPVGKAIKSVPVFAGATILGDGSVALILDVLGLAQYSRVIEEVRERAGKEPETHSEDAAATTAERYLVFGLGQRRRFALPLRQIDRLEEIPVAALEVAAGRSVIQYRESILPIVSLRQCLGVANATDAPLPVTEVDSDMTVLVYNDGRQRVGFIVDEIMDIVEDQLEIHSNSRERGILGTAVVDGRVTDVVDPVEVLEMQGLRNETKAAPVERLSA